VQFAPKKTQATWQNELSLSAHGDEKKKKKEVGVRVVLDMHIAHGQ